MEIMDKIRDVSRSVAVKSGEFAESGKLTYTIKKREREIKALQLEIGEKIFEDFKTGHSFGDDIAVLCQKIDDAYTEIARMESEKEKLGLEDLEVEVVDTDLPVDEDFEITDEENEILKDL